MTSQTLVRLPEIQWTEAIYADHRQLNDKLKGYQNRLVNVWSDILNVFNEVIFLIPMPGKTEASRDKKRKILAITLGYVIGILLVALAFPLLSGLFKITLMDFLNITSVLIVMLLVMNLNNKLLS
jgi:hypothetical protein